VSLILITNDDGIQSAALPALRHHLVNVGEVIVFAPDHNWSASSHTRTFHKPLRVFEGKLTDGTPATATNGGPADCAALAALGIFHRRPDLVVSGINAGSNLGRDVILSGTVAAAMESYMSGIPAIAVSLNAGDAETPDYDCAARFSARLARQVLQSGRKDLLLNVNVPNLPCDQIDGIEITRLGKLIYQESLVEREDPHGHKYYWFGGEPPDRVLETGTDVAAVAARHISVTPLQFDVTNYPSLHELASWQAELQTWQS
jgi:5'-nucleotidase